MQKKQQLIITKSYSGKIKNLFLLCPSEEYNDKIKGKSIKGVARKKRRKRQMWGTNASCPVNWCECGGQAARSPWSAGPLPTTLPAP